MRGSLFLFVGAMAAGSLPHGAAAFWLLSHAGLLKGAAAISTAAGAAEGRFVAAGWPVKWQSWKTASRESAHLAPLPQEHPEAVIQVYAAPLWGLRGLVADHTWIAAKEKGAKFYTVYEVIGWRLKAGYKDALRIAQDLPDRLWYGKRPRVLLDIRGAKAAALTKRIHKAALRYPYKTKYSMLFGPNSNTWTAWIACQIPELNLQLSGRAMGKNYVKRCLPLKAPRPDSADGPE